MVMSDVGSGTAGHRRRRRRRAAGVLACLGLLLAGCGRPQTQLVSPNFTNLDVRGILVRALVIVADDTATRAALGGAFLNTTDGPDTLTSVTVEPTVAPDSPRGDPEPPEDQSVSVEPNLPLPPGQLVEIGGPQDTQVVLPERPGGYRVGSYAQVILRFAEAGPVTTRVQVADPVTYLRPVAPGPLQTPTASTSS